MGHFHGQGLATCLRSTKVVLTRISTLFHSNVTLKSGSNLHHPFSPNFTQKLGFAKVFRFISRTPLGELQNKLVGDQQNKLASQADMCFYCIHEKVRRLRFRKEKS